MIETQIVLHLTSGTRFVLCRVTGVHDIATPRDTARVIPYINCNARGTVARTLRAKLHGVCKPAEESTGFTVDVAMGSLPMMITHQRNTAIEVTLTARLLLTVAEQSERVFNDQPQHQLRFTGAVIEAKS